MLYYNYIGYIAGLLTIITFIPQLIKIIKYKQVDQISLFTFFILISSQILWIIYGSFVSDFRIIYTNFMAGLISIFIISITFYYRKNTNEIV